MKTLCFKFMISILLFCFALATVELRTLAQGRHPAKKKRIQTVAQDRTSNEQKSEPYRRAISNYRNRRVDKIVGGEKVKRIEDYPWQVSLGESGVEIPDPYYAHFCGGSIYSDSWIVTAAHCVQGLSPKEFKITAGTIDLVKGGTTVEVKRVIVHKDYNRQTKDNDIALVELSTPLSLSDTIRTISLLLPSDAANFLTDSANFDVTGWGASEEGGRQVRDLRFITRIPVLKTATCNRPLFYNGKITDNMICAGTTGVDSCQGDSGGPLAINVGNGTKLLAGVVSWGEGCARPNKVGVYTRVTNYVQWINECASNSDNCNR